MSVNIEEAKKLIIQIIHRKSSGVSIPEIDRIFVKKMPEIIFGDEYKLATLIKELEGENIITWTGKGYTKGPNFPDDF